MRKLRILYIHQYFRTRAGAGSTRSYEFARRWVEAGHAVTMITSASENSALSTQGQRIARQTIDGIDVLVIDTSYSNYMSFRRRIVAFFAFMVWATWVGLRYVGRVDVVFATSTPLTVGIPGYLLSRWKRAPFVFEIRDLWPEVPIQIGALRNPLSIALARGLERFLYRAAVCVVTLSPGMYDALVQMGVPKSKLAMIPNCSDLDIFQVSAPNAELLTKYHLQGKFVLTYAGTMGMANGLDVLVEVARILQERSQTDIHLLLVGDGKERPCLEALAARYQLHNTTLLPAMSKLELAGLMPLSDICLTIFAPLPVLQTNSPNKLFDALALGRPVLINFGGWMQKVLEAHNAGIAVPSNDPQELADKIIELHAHPELLAEMGRNARALAEVEYDREKLCRQLESVLLSAASGRHKGKM
jgi:glycosyltransferase involved in cell wall biosynthesis